MQINATIWKRRYVEKIFIKHHLTRREVEEIFRGRIKFKLVEKGISEDEDLFTASGRTFEGRYIIVAFIYKKNKKALILSARDMTNKEKRHYAKK